MPSTGGANPRADLPVPPTERREACPPPKLAPVPPTGGVKAGCHPPESPHLKARCHPPAEPIRVPVTCDLQKPDAAELFGVGGWRQFREWSSVHLKRRTDVEFWQHQLRSVDELQGICGRGSGAGATHCQAIGTSADSVTTRSPCPGLVLIKLSPGVVVSCKANCAAIVCDWSDIASVGN